MSRINEVVVVGAGMAGLAAAKELEKAGFKVLILEASKRIGGRVASEIYNGYTLDQGFQVLPSSYRQTSRLLQGCKLKLNSFDSTAAVWNGQKFFEIGNPLRHPSQLLNIFKIFTVLDLFKIAKLILSKDAQSSSIETLKNSGFSRKSIDLFFTPFFSGVFLDQRLLTPVSFLRFALLTFLQGQAQLAVGGMAAIPKAIFSSLSMTEVRFHQKVSKVKQDCLILENGDIIRAKAIVFATDATTTKNIFDLPDQIKWRGTQMLYFSCNQAPFENKTIYINASSSGLICNLCLPSKITPEYAPVGKNLVSVSLRDSINKIDSVVLEQLTNELKSWFGASVEDWQLIKTYSIAEALPFCENQQTRHHKNLPENVFLAGDWFEIPSIEHAVKSGISAAQKAIKFLRQNGN